MPAAFPEKFPYWRLSAYYFFYFAFLGIFSPYFTLYLHSILFSAFEIGLLIGQMQLMRMLGPNIWGWLVDRHENKTGFRLEIIRFAALCSLIGFSFFLWLKTLIPLLICMAVLAFFWSAALPLVEMLTFDHLKEHKSQYSRIRLWGSIGFIVSVLVVGFLLDFLSPRLVLYAILFSLMGILILSWCLPDIKIEKTVDSFISVRDRLRNSRVMALLTACFFMSAAHGAYYVFYSIHMAAAGYSKTMIGALWALGVLAEITVFLKMNFLMRYFSLTLILFLSFAAAVVRFLLIAWCADFLMLAIFAQLLHGLTFGAYHASAISLVNQWFTGKSSARGQALYSSISFGAGGLFGTLLAGWHWERWGAAWIFSLSAVFALVGLLLVWFYLASPAAQKTPENTV